MPNPYVADRQTVADANFLISAFGDDAGFEAATRAEVSRDRGNVFAYCRWRQIERLIAALVGPDVTGTVH